MFREYIRLIIYIFSVIYVYSVIRNCTVDYSALRFEVLYVGFKYTNTFNI